MKIDFGVYGVRHGSQGWQRSTSYHPYELREGTAEEKERVSASGTGKRLLSTHDGDSGPTRSPESRDSLGTSRAHTAGQARSPFQR
jgi:hypothetical protein